MKSLSVRIIVFALLAGIAPAQEDNDKPEPTAANLKYGEHPRHVFDIWCPKGAGPSPLVLYIHGGGFRGGDKRNLNAARLKQFLEAGWAVAAINYRFTDSAPAPAQYLDCARALQTLRHRAKEWNLNPAIVASTGGSAGAGTSLWLAFHDDLADSTSDDPIARQSTRLTCVAVDNGQCSYDPRFAEKIGIPRPNFDRHDFFLPFYDIKADEIDAPKAYERYQMAAPLTYLTKDDPPALMSYTYPNDPVDANSNLALVVHHPKFGLALKERMDALDIECIVQYKGETGQAPVSPVDFIRKQFEKRQDALLRK